MKIKIATLFLLSVLVLLLSACGHEETKIPATDTQQAENTVETESTAKTEASHLDSLPDDLNFGGITVLLYDDKDLPIKDYHSEQTGEIVDDALYTRNRAVEERLNIILDTFDSEGAYEKREVFAERIRASVMADDGAYDIVAGYSLSVATLAVGGYLANLMNTDYLDFTMPWWSDSLTECLSVQNHLYFASGDISTNTLGTAFSVFFNKNLQQTYNMDDPYALVDAGKWTLDTLISMTKDIYEDLNADGKKGKEDRFGLSANNTSFDNLYFSSGMKMTDRLPDGSIVVSEDWGGEKVKSLVEILCDFFHNDTGTYFSDETGGSAMEVFIHGNAIFMLAGMNMASTSLRNVDFEYGIVPTPKWDEAQEQFHTVAAYTGGMYCIPVNAKDVAVSSAVMEAMAMEGYYTLAPAFFETAMKIKYASDSSASRMYDIIKGSLMFDFGRMFSTSSLNSIPSNFRGAIEGNDVNWMSRYKSTLPLFKSLLANLTETLISIE